MHLKFARTDAGCQRWVLVALFPFLFQAIFAAAVLAFMAGEENTIAVYEAVAPSIVNITTSSVQLDFFFRPVPTSGAGSGIIVDEDGTIVTNYHVIAGAHRLEVTLSDGSRWAAHVIGKSARNDLAAIRIKAEGHSLKAIPMGNSDNLEVGQKVLAIGNPFGLGQTLSVGTISHLARSIRAGRKVLRNLIQIDASINPGNSGGALVDSRGRLIGINTAILSPTGASVGIGFAIPVNRVKKVLPGLISVWGRWLGWILAILIAYWILRRIYRL